MMLKVKTLTEKELKKSFQNFFNNIIHEYNPEVIFFVANAGVYLKQMIDGEYDNSKFHILKMQRKTTPVKNILFNKIKLQLLRKLPNSILNFLRNIEHKIYLKTKFSEVSKNKITIKNFNKKKILIVDDAIDTGSTMKLIIDSIKDSNPESIVKTAVIVRTNHNSIVVPDYLIFKNILIRFPWSLDYNNSEK
jgi:hypoxanthine phosphoribosyltransferase